MLLPVFDDEEVDGLLELGRTQCCFLVFDDEEVGGLLELGRAHCCFLVLMTRRWTGYWS